ncbi:MAG: hypothetical protein KatS3mg131_3958 [Candidatus Tectimicrobiota bacterium]|nr:MAG: hypothetical protein KatS3mg131_3958 [Candidatus Tectomicrobia bacterium]
MGREEQVRPPVGDVETPAALEPLVARLQELLQQLEALQHELGPYFERLAAVDWQALAREGKLAGIPRLSIERTLLDARQVLASGLRELAEELRLVREGYPGVGRQRLDAAARLRSVIRRYVDAPADIRTRHQRLVAWVAQIDEALRQRGDTPLSAQLAAAEPDRPTS